MLISFCIPTFNRRDYLKQSIVSIINQLNDALLDEIEICISDNCSTDGTIEMIELLKNEFKNVHLIYKVNDFNIGPDLNYLESIKIASGKYCWFLGSDDLIQEGAIKKMYNLLHENHFDIVICNRLECTEELKPHFFKSWYSSKEKTVFELTDKKQLHEYLKSCKDTACIFSYLSSIIFYREKWNSIEYDNSFTGTAYSHVFMLFSFLKFNSCILKTIDEPLVICRMSSGNSFLDKGFANRLFIDFDGYFKISKLNYFDKESQRLLLKIVSDIHPLYRLIRVKCYSNKTEWNKLYTSLGKGMYPPINLFVLRFIPLPVANKFRDAMPFFVWFKKTIRHKKFILGIKK